MDIGSESMLNSAVKKLLNELKNKWLTYFQRYDVSYKNMRFVRAWLKKIAEVQENLRLQFDCASDQVKTSFTREKSKKASFAATSDTGPLLKTHCPLMHGEHKIWQCNAFKKMKVSEHKAVKKMPFVFFLSELWSQDWLA